MRRVLPRCLTMVHCQTKFWLEQMSVRTAMIARHPTSGAKKKPKVDGTASALMSKVPATRLFHANSLRKIRA